MKYVCIRASFNIDHSIRRKRRKTRRKKNTRRWTKCGEKTKSKQMKWTKGKPNTKCDKFKGKIIILQWIMGKEYSEKCFLFPFEITFCSLDYPFQEECESRHAQNILVYYLEQFNNITSWRSWIELFFCTLLLCNVYCALCTVHCSLCNYYYTFEQQKNPNLDTVQGNHINLCHYWLLLLCIFATLQICLDRCCSFRWIHAKTRRFVFIFFFFFFASFLFPNRFGLSQKQRGSECRKINT